MPRQISAQAPDRRWRSLCWSFSRLRSSSRCFSCILRWESRRARCASCSFFSESLFSTSAERNACCTSSEIAGPRRASSSPARLTACWVWAQRAVKVRGVVHHLAVDLDDYASGAEPGFFSAAAFFNRAHQYPVAVFDAEEFSELSIDVLDHQTAAQTRVDQ